MEKKGKEALIKLLKIAIPSFVCLACIIWFYIHEAKQMKEEPIFTKGVITGKFSGTQGQSMVRYEFYVDKVKYISSWGYSWKYDIIETGDTCFVIYAQSNPKNCKLVEIMSQGKSIIKLQKAVRKNDALFNQLKVQN